MDNDQKIAEREKLVRAFCDSVSAEEFRAVVEGIVWNLIPRTDPVAFAFKIGVCVVAEEYGRRQVSNG